MRLFATILTGALLAGCGVKGDPVPYLEVVRRAEEAQPAAAAAGPSAPASPAPLVPKSAP